MFEININYELYEELLSAYQKKYQLAEGDWNMFFKDFNWLPRKKFFQLMKEEPRIKYLSPTINGAYRDEVMQLGIDLDAPITGLEDIENLLARVDRSTVTQKTQIIESILEHGIEAAYKNHNLAKLLELNKTRNVKLYRAGDNDTSRRFGAHILGESKMPLSRQLDEYQDYPVSWWFVDDGSAKLSSNTFLQTGTASRQTYKATLNELLENGIVSPDENSMGLVYIDLKGGPLDPAIM